ncbi:4-carboxymuconolactone decarboxylase [Anaerolineae bacterium]|nr:4-carboxymuconolactone decarboxylase [Anaerolineae bacterium]
MTHFAIAEQLNGKAVEWMEKVRDEQYNTLSSTPGGGITMSKEPSAAQKMIGDFTPKLVELTDNVLFGDVWERQELSKRDRSLVTVAALIAMNRPEQLRVHLDKALDNGLKKEELIEAITHLALYSGWPNAMTAMMTAKEQFAKKDASN